MIENEKFNQWMKLNLSFEQRFQLKNEMFTKFPSIPIILYFYQHYPLYPWFRKWISKLNIFHRIQNTCHNWKWGYGLCLLKSNNYFESNNYQTITNTITNTNISNTLNTTNTNTNKTKPTTMNIINEKVNNVKLNNNSTHSLPPLLLNNKSTNSSLPYQSSSPIKELNNNKNQLNEEKFIKIKNQTIKLINRNNQLNRLQLCHTSSGIGSHWPGRLFCEPEFALFDIQY
jgi:hypothetical protein